MNSPAVDLGEDFLRSFVFAILSGSRFHCFTFVNTVRVSPEENSENGGGINKKSLAG